MQKGKPKETKHCRPLAISSTGEPLPPRAPTPITLFTERLMPGEALGAQPSHRLTVADFKAPALLN